MIDKQIILHFDNLYVLVGTNADTKEGLTLFLTLPFTLDMADDS